MKKSYILILLCLSTASIFAQDPIIDEWIYNSTSKTSSYWQNTGTPLNQNYVFNQSTVLADVLTICFDADTVWIESEGMTNDMGQYVNADVPQGMGYTFTFPRNPIAGSGTESAPDVSGVGVLVNGIPMFGLSDGTSYHPGLGSNENNGAGVWVGDAYWSEGFTLDTAFAAHPQGAGAYHSHATPFRLYEDPDNAHSPIIGFANDGFPVYGPFGYSSANDNTSGITRMVSGYELRNITNRSTLPGGGASMPAGPTITTGGNFDLGTYIQDYEYVGGGSSTLDEHNGRLCVTPEYPSGTYAYFVTVDAVGTPQFPYYIGTTYYGTPVNSNQLGSGTIPTSGTQCFPLSTSVTNNDFNTSELAVYPNPSNGIISIDLPEEATGQFDLKVIDNTGKMVYSKNMIEANDIKLINLENLSSGIYMVRIIGYNQLFTSKFIKE
jgi:hypothetical protein